MSEYPDVPDFEGMDLCEHLEEAAQTLKQVTLFALGNPVFRGYWEAGIREVADRACAEIAGHRMAGHQAGLVAAGTDATVPVPDGWDEEKVFEAFGLAVMGEMRRRLSVMMDSPAGGTG